MDETYNELNLKFYEPTNVEGVILRETILVYKPDDWGLTKDNAMLEMGAHTGTLSMYCAKKYGCKVYAYEPCIETYDKLLQNIALNDLGHLIVPFNCAVTKDGRDVVVAQNPKNSGANSIYGEGENFIHSITLKEAIQRIRDNGDFIQVLLMDAEGAELELLEDPEVVRGIPEFRGEFHDRCGDIDTLLESLLKVNPNAKPGMQRRDLQKTFTKIYKTNKWKSHETRSGSGAEIKHTRNIRYWLPSFVKGEGIKSIVDAGCGDFNWMKTLKLYVHYYGYDIVQEMIDQNQRLYGTRDYPTRDFFVANIIKDKLHKADLAIVRDVVYHLSYRNIWKVIKNVSKTTSRYLLISSHSVATENHDIRDGRFRRVNLMIPPFSFPLPLQSFPDTHVSDELAEEMLLYRIQTIKDFLEEVKK